MAKNLIRRNSGYKGMAKIGRKPIQPADKIPGGLAKGKTINDLKAKYNVSYTELIEQIDKGKKVEMEHTSDEKIATEIAFDHLWESLEYYIKLEKMEAEINAGNKPENTDAAEMEFIKGHVNDFIEESVFRVGSKVRIAHTEYDWETDTQGNRVARATMHTDKGKEIVLLVNPEDSGEVILRLPNGDEFAGDTISGAEYADLHINSPARAKDVIEVPDIPLQAPPNVPLPEIKIEEPETPQQINFKSQLERINHIKKLIDEKGEDIMNYSEAELMLLRTYEGFGGQQNNVKEIETGVLDQYYTPYNIIEKMWGLALKHGFTFTGKKAICEPSCGIGRFFEYIPEVHDVTGYEIDKYAYTIAKLTFRKFRIINEPFETHFWDTKLNIKREIVAKYDLFIGNPPYRKLEGKYIMMKDVIGMTEKEYTMAETFEQYMMIRGIDLLFPGGLLIFIIPNTFLSNDSSYNLFKDKLSAKAELIDAYRLPNGVFANTQIGTDIVVFKKK